MTTIFIWNNCQVSATWNAALKKCKIKGSDKWSHAISGHAAVMISDDWEKPIKQIAQTKIILDEYDKLRVAWNKAKDGSAEQVAAQVKMEKQGALFEEQLTDKSESYVSFFPDEYNRSSHTSTPIADQIKKKLGINMSVSHFRKGLTHKSFWHDLLWENYVPDHIIFIPDTTAQKQNMKKAWDQHKNKKGGDISYRFKYKNCSRMASRVLIAGFGSLLGWYWSGKVAARKIWTPLHVKRLANNIATKVDGARALTWNEFVDDMVKRGVVPQASGQKLKKYKRRAGVRGSTEADARFTYTNGNLTGKGDQNSADFLEPVLGKKHANNVGHIYGLSYDFTKSALEIAQEMGLAQADNSVSEPELLGDDFFSDDFDPTAASGIGFTFSDT